MAMYDTAISIIESAAQELGIGTVSLGSASTGNAGPITGITAILNEVKAIYEVKYGGTLSWTSQTNGSFVDYSITYEGLTTDPATDSLNGFDIVMFAVQNDSLEYYSAMTTASNINFSLKVAIVTDYSTIKK